ncbi:MAG: homoserine dehydrogenase [Clostridia bacterium]
MKKTGVAILGYGTVGGGTYQLILSRSEQIKAEYGIDLSLQAVLVRNKDKAITKGADAKYLTTNIKDITLNPSINIVAECIGGIEPARTYIIECLRAGKNVVTANKELLAKHWDQLEAEAKKTNTGIYFEATCAGGVPIIRTMTTAMQANNILQIKGIINGTTNYILSRMTDEGASYYDVLKDAQKLGFAEANPSADVDGFDAMYKLSILSTLAFNKKIPTEFIFREGISKITKEDIQCGKEMGLVIKLLAIAKMVDGKLEARVHPAFIPKEHPLANVSGAFNAIFLVGDAVGDIMLYGRGAGALPTGSAVLSDIAFCAGKTDPPRYQEVEKVIDKNEFNDNFETEYYIRLNVHDKAGVLADITQIFKENDVSITSLTQKEGVDVVPIIFLTHKTFESNLKNSIAKIEKLDSVMSVENIIRVERN